jgi:flavin reductase (DIM6/NTAB) family NADH-FMN oxidoreductase RutF
MPTDPLQFRKVMGYFPTGVTVVTARTAGGAPCGLTANAVAAVSLDPLLLLVCLASASETHAHVLESNAFAVNLLDARSEDLARRFSSGDRESRFEDLRIRVEVTGSPVLENALGWLDCRVSDVLEAGDHTIVVGRVMACDVRTGQPLVFCRGTFGELAAP